MADPRIVVWWNLNQTELMHAVRTTVAAVISLLIARLFRLPESYWASITTLAVLQSTLGAAWTISKQRFAGTALGAFAGALLASYLPGSVGAFATGLLAVGIICAILAMERNAYRYAGITVAIVVLIPHTALAWIVGLHRFIEISIGIAVGLAVAALWPEALVRAAARAAE